MNEQTAGKNLAAAQLDRARRADAELEHVRTGWALFTPQRINDVIDARERALASCTYWMEHGG